jgi:hypothetical protein
VPDHRGERRGLATAGRSGDDDEAAALPDEAADDVGQPELVDRRDRRADGAHDDRHRPALHVGVDAEDPHVGDDVRAVQLAVALELLDARLGNQLT